MKLSEEQKYVPDAFAAPGVCAELWQTDFTINNWSGLQAEFPVAVINDTDQSYTDYFTIEVMKADSICSHNTFQYRVALYGINRTIVKIDLPKIAGSYSIITTLHGRKSKPVKSWRDINLKNEK